ncbi:hypothetical protein [Alteromonas sp. a30]|uniref:hypothetical protein n=1 Tax=Alteromonas sp. a30 TaxID=2730917 RepID=UPI00227F1149|nr:hypothetical protein [Alteromonas sp. a30]MCY7296087.1 hypothetical protein [Alteromonas sp. a30]
MIKDNADMRGSLTFQNSSFVTALFVLGVLIFCTPSLAYTPEAEAFASGQQQPYRQVDSNAMPFSSNNGGIIPVQIVPSVQSLNKSQSYKEASSTNAYNVTMGWASVDFAQQYRLEKRRKGTQDWSVVYQGDNTIAELTNHPSGEFEFQVIGCLINPAQPTTPLCEEVAHWSDIATVDIGGGTCQACDSVNALMQTIAQEHAFEPYYFGQRKSVDSVSVSKAGNAVELSGAFLTQAAALASVTSAEFVYGRIRVDVDNLTSWLGVGDVQNAAQILAIGGANPQIFVQTQNGPPVYVEMDHVWAEVNGVVADPSFQIKSVPTIKNLQNDAGASSQSVLDALAQAGAFDNPDGIMLPDLNQFDELIESNQETVRSHLAQSTHLTYSDYLASKEISLSSYEYGQALPYDIVREDARHSVSADFGGSDDIFDVLPALKRERLIVRTSGINYTVNMDKALDTSVVIDYVAATTSDQSTIDSNGGLLNTPYQGVSLKPRLLIDGQEVARGNAKSVGSYDTITVEMLDGGESSNVCNNFNKKDCRDIVTHNVTVGGVHAIALDGQYIDGTSLEQEAAALQGLSQTYASNLLDSRFAGPLLSYLGRSYHKQLDVEVQNASASTGSLIFHQVNEAIISIDLTARQVADGSYKMSVGSRRIDAPRNLFAILPHQASNSYDSAPVLFALGQAASALEHAVFAKAMGWPAESTMSILRYAANHEQPIYVINQTNKDSLLPQLSYRQEMITNLSNLIDDGRIVITPSGPQTISDWEGVGFIALDPDTGAAAFIINGGAAGGEQPLGALTQQQTNNTFAADVSNILSAIGSGVGAGVDGLLYGTYNEVLYPTPLLQNIATGSTLISDFLLVGDIRNLGISSYEAAFNNGSYGDVGIAIVGIAPWYDIGKGAYKTADNVFDIKGLDNIADTLGSISDASAVYLGNLTRNADIYGATSFSLENSINSVVTSASRNGLDFTSVVVQDANAFSNSLGLSLNGLTSAGAKGQFGEAAAQSWARSNGLECYFCSADTSAQGFDNVFRNPSTGEFIVSESKWVSSNSNIGVGTLSNTNNGRQLSESWMFGVNGDGVGSALSRTSNLSQSQRTELLTAFQNGNVRTQLVVVRPRHVGSGVTQRLANDATFGANGSQKLNDIVIIEVPVNP